MIISPDSCPDANSNSVAEAQRNDPGAVIVRQRLLPAAHPAHSLSSMPLIVLGRGGPFLLTTLVLLFLQGPALRT